MFKKFLRGRDVKRPSSTPGISGTTGIDITASSARATKRVGAQTSSSDAPMRPHSGGTVSSSQYQRPTR